jgi:hypothetical protein
MQSSLPTAAERLRLAVAAGSYVEVQQLLTEYGSEVEACWRASSEEQRRLIAQEATSLLAWARHTILAHRAHAQHRKAQFARQSAYARVAMQRRAIIELDA